MEDLPGPDQQLRYVPPTSEDIAEAIRHWSQMKPIPPSHIEIHPDDLQALAEDTRRKDAVPGVGASPYHGRIFGVPLVCVDDEALRGKPRLVEDPDG